MRSSPWRLALPECQQRGTNPDSQHHKTHQELAERGACLVLMPNFPVLASVALAEIAWLGYHSHAMYAKELAPFQTLNLLL